MMINIGKKQKKNVRCSEYRKKTRYFDFSSNEKYKRLSKIKQQNKNVCEKKLSNKK